MGNMTSKQKEKFEQLEDELRKVLPTSGKWALPIRGESDCYVFTEVQGVTVLITRKSYNPRGGYKVPAVRSYTETVAPTNLDAAVRAKKLFDAQNPDPNCKYGHLNPLVDTDWKCGNVSCRCSSESYQRRMERSIGNSVRVRA